MCIDANYASRGIKAGDPSPPWLIKIVMAYLCIILWDEFQTAGKSQLYCSC